MKLLSFFGNKEARDSLENPSVPLYAALVGTTDGALDSATGAAVTPQRAMRIVAYIACVKLISETIASLPLYLYSRDGRTRTIESQDHRFDLLHISPNPELTAFEFWQYMLLCFLVYGNAYAWIQSDSNGQIVALWPIHPSNITKAASPNGAPLYLVDDGNGRTVAYFAEEIMQFRGLGLDTSAGLSSVWQARAALGISMAAEDYAGRIFQNDSTPGGIISSQKNLTDEQFNTFMSNWKAGHEGVKNSHKVGLLPPGFDYTANQFNPEDSQMMEARRFQVEEIARLMRIPPHMIGHPVTSSYNSLEQQSLEFVTYTLWPILRNLQQRVTKSLFRFPADLPKQLFVEFDYSALLRTDVSSQSNMDRSDRMYGIKTSNEIRETRGLPPVEGGDDLWMPTNTSAVLPDGTLAGVKAPTTNEVPPDVAVGETDPNQEPGDS